MAESTSNSLQAAEPPQKSDNKRPRPDENLMGTATSLETQDAPQSKRPRRSQRQRGAKEKRLPVDIEAGEAADTGNNPSFSGDSHAPSQPSHSGWNQGVKGRLRTSFGRPTNIAAEAKSPIISFGSGAEKDTDDPTTQGQSEDNQAESEPRSFATGEVEAESRAKTRATRRVRKLAKGRSKDTVSAVEADTPVATQTPANPASPVPLHQAESSVMYQGQTWHLPPLAKAEENAAVKSRNVWDGKFVKWFETLLAVNPGNTLPKTRPKNAAALINLVKEAYVSWHGQSEWANKNHRDEAIQAMYRHRKAPRKLTDIIGKHRKQRDGAGSSTDHALEGDMSRGQAIAAAEAAVKGRLAAEASATPSAATTADSNDLEDGEIDSMVSSSSDDGMVEDDGEDDEIEPAELEGQAEDLIRYFPGIGANTVFCISCAGYGHRSNNCPEATCRFCKEKGHLSLACPTRQRCSKCRQLGHDSHSCQEKLKSTGEEGFECAFCQSRTHTEETCNDFYRSYWPGEDEIRKVKNIPVFCYTCGTEGHFGTECGVGGKVLGTVVETWSKANWTRYVDSGSTVEPVAGAAMHKKTYADRPDLGHGIAPRRHEYYEESDDDDDDYFIREQVRQPRRNGQINIAPPSSRAGQGPARNGNHQGQNREFNPPLPPGPPPSYAAAAMSSLPARPPQPNHNSNRQEGQRNPRDRSGQNRRWQETNGQTQSKRNSGNGQGSSRGGRGGRGGRGFSSLRGRGGFRGRN